MAELVAGTVSGTMAGTAAGMAKLVWKGRLSFRALFSNPQITSHEYAYKENRGLDMFVFGKMEVVI